MCMKDMFPLCIHKPAGGNALGSLPDRIYVAVNDDEFPEYVDVERGYAGLGTREKRRYVPERTCIVESSHGYTDAFVQTRYVHELSCHTLDEWPDREPPHFCPICGAKVTRKEAKRNV